MRRRSLVVSVAASCAAWLAQAAALAEMVTLACTEDHIAAAHHSQSDDDQFSLFIDYSARTVTDDRFRPPYKSRADISPTSVKWSRTPNAGIVHLSLNSLTGRIVEDTYIAGRWNNTATGSCAPAQPRF
jgi:hypothetical protein